MSARCQRGSWPTSSPSMTSLRFTQTGPRPSMASPSPSKRGSSSASWGRTARARAPRVKILTTLLRKTSGSVSIAGYDLEKNPKEIRKVIGVQSQETSVDPELTGRENMILEGNLQQMHGKAVGGAGGLSHRSGRAEGRGRQAGRPLLRRDEEETGPSPRRSSTSRRCSSLTSRPPGSTHSRARPCGTTSRSSTRRRESQSS